MVQESPPPSTTPMLPDVDISPLAAAVMAQDIMEEAQKVVDEAQEEMKVEIGVKGEPELPKVEGEYVGLDMLPTNNLVWCSSWYYLVSR